MQIEKFNDFHPEHIFLYERILHLLQPTKQCYPQLNKWYREVFLVGLMQKERAYIIAQDDRKLVGCALLKKTPGEKKICSLYVKSDYRKKGIGEQMLKMALSELGKNPEISISQINIHFFQPLLERYGFQLSYKKRGEYSPNKTEYHFNTPKPYPQVNKLER